MAVSKVILNGETLIDVTQKTVTPSNMLSGITALKNDGTDITGSIATKSSSDLVVSGSSVTVPSGMYGAAAVASVAAGSVQIPELYQNLAPYILLDTDTGVITANNVSITVDVTPTVTSGYVTSVNSGHVHISGDQDTYALPTLTEQTITPTESSRSLQASGYYMLGNVNVEAIPSNYIGSAIPTRSSTDLTASGSVVTVPSGWYGTAASTAIASGLLNEYIPLPSIKPTWSLNSSTGTINAQHEVAYGIYPIASSGYFETDEDIYPMVTMNTSYQLPTKGSATITPSTSSQTIASGYFLTGVQTIAAMPTGSVTLPYQEVQFTPQMSINASTGVITAENMGTSVSITPTVSSGYVSSVDTGYVAFLSASSSLALPTRSSANLTASGSIVTVPSGWYGAAASTAIAAGSIAVSSYTFNISPDVTLNSANGKIDLWKALSYTLPVSLTSGYISQASGPLVKAIVDSNYQLPTKAAATITPTTSDQVVASGYFLTGAQTIKGDANLVASNIITGASIFGVVGTAQGSANLQDNKTVAPSSAQQIVLPDLINEVYTSIANGTISTAPTSNEVFTVSKSPVDDKSYYFSGAFHGEDNTVISVDGTITASSGGCNFTSILTVSGSSSVFYAYWSNGTVEFVTSAGHLTTDGDFVIYEAPLEYYDGLAQVTVEGAPLQAKTVTPATTSQVVIASPTLDGYVAAGSSSVRLNPLFDIGDLLDNYTTYYITGAISVETNTLTDTISFNSEFTTSNETALINIPFTHTGSIVTNIDYAANVIILTTGYEATGIVTSDIKICKASSSIDYYGLSQVTVEAIALQSKTVTPSSSQQIITPDTSRFITIPYGSSATISYGDTTFNIPAGVAGTSYYINGRFNTMALGFNYDIKLDGTVTYSSSGANLSSIATVSGTTLYGNGIVWDQNGLLISLNTGSSAQLVVAKEVTFDSLPIVNYHGLSQVTVEAVAATSSYYVTQDSEGYLCYSSSAPSSSGYYVFNVSSEHII